MPKLSIQLSNQGHKTTKISTPGKIGSQQIDDRKGRPKLSATQPEWEKGHNNDDRVARLSFVKFINQEFE